MASLQQAGPILLKSVAITFASPRVAPAPKAFERSGIAVSVFQGVQNLAEHSLNTPIHAAVVEFACRPNREELQALTVLRKSSPKLPIIVSLPPAEREYQSEVIQSGATDVLSAPLGDEILLAALIRRLFPERVTAGHSKRNSLGPLIGNSEPMQLLYDAITRVAGSNSTVLIRGESGTGKELVARTIVALSPRRDKPFIRLNCAALPEALMESELFGSERGAYTGAVASRPGHIELAQGGTLFLDEIATLPISLQTKLLRVIEDRAVQRLGSASSKTIDFRLLTATNEALEQLVKAGRFREDLYYRINVIPIRVPALRERRSDVAMLANHYINVYCRANGIPPKRLELDALEVLEESPWSGNVRELENLIQRLILMVEGPTITVHHLPEQMIYESTTRHEALLIPEEGLDFDKEMERIEVAYLQAALRRCGGKKVTAAALLRINEQRMKYLCRKYRVEGLDVASGE